MGNNPIEELEVLPPNKVVKLHNRTCVYCSEELSNIENNEEHVIGRKFVPKKSLNNQWNLIVRACKKCNTKKSDLEDDISAISMQPDLNGSNVVDDENLATESLRKSKSISRRTNKTVLNSNENLTLKTPFFGGSIKIDLKSAPQLDSQRIFELARYHITAFFYWLTYDETTKMGNVWDGVYFPIHTTINKNWGSNLNQAFMRMVSDWEIRLRGETANGFFKFIIKRQAKSECGSWALEWNKNYRVIGFFGDKESMEEFYALLHKPEVKGIKNFTYQKEIPLSDDDDILFKLNI
jgi:hypothetical protein